MLGLVWFSVALAVLAMVYLAARHQTAGVSATTIGAAALFAAAVAGGSGWSGRGVAGAVLVAAGVAAVAWALGRSRRRYLARCTAVAAYRGMRAGLPEFAARLERQRLAAELHDTAAHRFTAIVVGSTAALRLAEPELAAEALRTAAAEGRAAAAELSRLAEGAEFPWSAEAAGLIEIDALVAQWSGKEIGYRRAVADVPPEIAAVAFRVVRESLTNVLRYAPGAGIDVCLETSSGALVVTVANLAPEPAKPLPEGGPGSGLGGGPGIELGSELSVGLGGGPGIELGVGLGSGLGVGLGGGLGSGRGLSGLRAAVSGQGGSMSAGAHEGGWMVRAVLPLAVDAGSPSGGWRGRRAIDLALALLAVALSAGVSLLPAENPPLTLLQALAMVPLFILHALPLAWRGRSPALALGAAVCVYPPLVAAWQVTGALQPVGNVFLLCGWVELVLLYAVGVRGWGRTWPVALPLAGAAYLLGWLVVAPVAAWGLGIAVGVRRERRRRALVQRDNWFAHQAETALLAERERIATGLRTTVLRKVAGVVTAADAGRLDVVVAEARAGLVTLRELLDRLNTGVGGDPPPTLEALAVLGVRRRVDVRYEGRRRALHPSVEVAAFIAGTELMREGGDEEESVVTVTYLRDGVAVSGLADGVTRRRLLALADAAGGDVSGTVPGDHSGAIGGDGSGAVDGDGSGAVGRDVSGGGAVVRVWLPEADLA
ncbi:histidine kinase [Nonomuraea endophytica]|uniref:histidine kinase n=1 Tax=Nonomuraea endophytica TaxID=714136 RepID=UPI0037CB6F55